MLQINLHGAFFTTQQVLPAMMKQRYGRIVNIASVVGESGNAGQANYVTSKAGLIGLTKALAQEMAAREITVNAVAPGFIDTDMTAVLTDELKEKTAGAGAAAAAGPARGDRGGRAVSGQRRGRLYHGPGAGRERRNVYVGQTSWSVQSERGRAGRVPGRMPAPHWRAQC